MKIQSELMASHRLWWQSNSCCHKSFYRNPVSRIDGPFVKTLKGAKSPHPPTKVGVYKVGLIDESSANSLHLVRVWKSGEDVRKKAWLGQRVRGTLQVKQLLPRKQAVLWEPRARVQCWGQTFFCQTSVLSDTVETKKEHQSSTV